MPIVQNLKRAFSFSVPSFFWHKNVDSFPNELPIFPHLYFTILLFSMLWLIYKILSSSPLLTHLQSKVFHSKFELSSNYNLCLKEHFILFHIIIYILFYSLSFFNHISPRYLLPIQPFAIIIISIVVVDLYRDKSFLFRFISIFIIVMSFLVSAIANYQVFKDKKVSHGLYEEDGEVVYEIIKFLKKEKIRCVRTDYFLQWRIIFESKEEVIAGYHGFGNSIIRYPDYEIAVKKCKKFAYILNRKVLYYEWLKRTLNIKKLKYKENFIRNMSVLRVEIPEYNYFL